MKVTFGKYTQLAITRDGIDFLFNFVTIDDKYIGKPEEFRMAREHHIIVGISGTLATMWGLQQSELVKTLFEFGKRHIIEKIKDGTLTQKEELQLATSNAPNKSPFDTSRIPDPQGFEVVVPMEGHNLHDNTIGLQIGGQIVDMLDNINAIFHDHYNELLFVPLEFRATLEMVRPANSKEEYIVRVLSLSQLIDRLSVPALRRITRETDSQVRSISLLEQYLSSLESDPDKIVKTLRAIVRLRQGYPVHTDTADGVREAHKYLGINYPVTDFVQAWLILRGHFLNTLTEIRKSVERDVK
jgi:hypothetical protein